MLLSYVLTFVYFTCVLVLIVNVLTIGGNVRSVLQLDARERKILRSKQCDRCRVEIKGKGVIKYFSIDGDVVQYLGSEPIVPRTNVDVSEENVVSYDYNGTRRSFGIIQGSRERRFVWQQHQLLSPQQQQHHQRHRRHQADIGEWGIGQSTSQPHQLLVVDDVATAFASSKSGNFNGVRDKSDYRDNNNNSNRESMNNDFPRTTDSKSPRKTSESSHSVGKFCKVKGNYLVVMTGTYADKLNFSEYPGLKYWCRSKKSSCEKKKCGNVEGSGGDGTETTVVAQTTADGKFQLKLLELNLGMSIKVPYMSKYYNAKGDLVDWSFDPDVNLRCYKLMKLRVRCDGKWSNLSQFVQYSLHVHITDDGHISRDLCRMKKCRRPEPLSSFEMAILDEQTSNDGRGQLYTSSWIDPYRVYYWDRQSKKFKLYRKFKFPTGLYIDSDGRYMKFHVRKHKLDFFKEDGSNLFGFQWGEWKCDEPNMLNLKLCTDSVFDIGELI